MKNLMMILVGWFVCSVVWATEPPDKQPEIAEVSTISSEQSDTFPVEQMEDDEGKIRAMYEAAENWVKSTTAHMSEGWKNFKAKWTNTSIESSPPEQEEDVGSSLPLSESTATKDDQ